MQLRKEQHNITLKAIHLNVWKQEVRSRWWRGPCKPKVNNILKDVSVTIHTGEFVAVLGPSGAGKTTFLASLAGKCNLPSTGLVTVNGYHVRGLGRGAVDFVPQSDVFVDDLCVLEHMIFMTEMKLGSAKKPSNQIMLQGLMKELKLKSLENTKIRSLSGGERRLLSLATSLLSDPHIVLCDEPTTGLDSYSAALVVGVLKRLSKSGKIVMCTLHQPASALFREFDTICLISDGRLLFNGSHEDCRSEFQSIGLRCPKHYNPAEFYLNKLSVDVNTRNLVRLLEINSDTNDTKTGSAALVPCPYKTFKRNWFKQVSLLVWRSYVTLSRDIKGHLLQLFICVLLSALLVGTCFVGVSGTTQRGVQDFNGFLWLLCSEVSFTMSYSALYVIESDITLFTREAGVYSASAFYVSRFLTMVPRCVIWPCAYVLLATIFVELPSRLMTTVELTVALIAIAISSAAYGLGMGALFVTTGVMGDVMPCVDLPLFLMSGTFIRISSLPLWIHLVKYISHFFYGMDAISNIYWRQVDYIDCPENSTSSCLSDGRAVLLEAGYSDGFVLKDSLGIALVTLTWSVLGYFGLKREENKGYAY